MAKKIITIATRKSALALWQANFVQEQLQKLWPKFQFNILPLITSGDTYNKDKLTEAGGKGLFVKELEEALLNNKADLAVHSMKDVPTEFPAGLFIGAICERHNPFDALVSYEPHTLKNLPVGSIIGTSSLRRQSQILKQRPDCVVKPLRGNVNTRLTKLKEGDFDAIILAVSGLERLNLQGDIKEVLHENIMLPAAGQGALGIECRLEDNEIKRLIAPLNDSISALCVNVERQVNFRLGGSCHTPIAIYCKPEGNHFLLRANVLSPDGSLIVSNSQQGTKENILYLADLCAEELIKKGAHHLLSVK